MLGDKLMLILVVEYLVIATVFAFEGTWVKTMYWLGAAVITTSVLLMR